MFISTAMDRKIITCKENRMKILKKYYHLCRNQNRYVSTYLKIILIVSCLQILSNLQIIKFHFKFLEVFFVSVMNLV